MKFTSLLIAALIAAPVSAGTGGVAMAQSQPAKAVSAAAQMDPELRRRLTVMSDAFVIEMLYARPVHDLTFASDKTEMLAKIGAWHEEQRTLFWLNYLRGQMRGKPMHFFFTDLASSSVPATAMSTFFMMQGIDKKQADELSGKMHREFDRMDGSQYAALIAQALATAGLHKQRDAFVATQKLAKERPYADFSDLDAAFGSREDLVAGMTAYLHSRPDLARYIDHERPRTHDEDRLFYLVHQMKALSPEEIEGLPTILRQIHLVDPLVPTIMAVDVADFFREATGNRAPDVVVALRDFGLQKTADALQRGVDMMVKPYPASEEIRWNLHFRGGDYDLRQKLRTLDKDIDPDAIRQAMVSRALAEGVLPQ